MRAKAVSLVALGLVLWLCGCEKDLLMPPEVQTVSVDAISPTIATFVGNVSKLGSEKIVDYGFFYSFSGQVDENNGTRVSLGDSPVVGEFSTTEENLRANSSSYNHGMLWVRAYIQDTKGTVFGGLKQVALPTPSTSGMIPSSGKSGDQVTIHGKFYDPEVEDIFVSFQGVSAKILAANDSEITVEVPSGIGASHGQSVSVSITARGVPLNQHQSFSVLAHFKDFSPKSGPVGTVLTFSGDNLPTSYYYSSPIIFHFGNVALNRNNYLGQINVPFTIGLTSEIAVSTGGQRKVLPDVFTVTPPQITSTNMAEVFPGQQLIAYGTNFPPYIDYGDNRPSMKLGTTSYQQVSSYSASQMSFSVPHNTPEGEHVLYLKIGPHEVQAPEKIKVLGYAVSGFSPSEGGPGREVNITGRFIQNQGYNVFFGNAMIYGTATTATNLRVHVPNGIEAGKVKIAVEVPNERITAPGEFEVLGPSFHSFYPTSGVPGTLVTIKGAGFNTNYWGTSVKFGTVAVTPNSITEDTIVVAVPSNVTPGSMKLTVETNGQSIMHSDNFTILN